MPMVRERGDTEVILIPSYDTKDNGNLSVFSSVLPSSYTIHLEQKANQFEDKTEALASVFFCHKC
jgi:hypothetical protein